MMSRWLLELSPVPQPMPGASWDVPMANWLRKKNFRMTCWCHQEVESCSATAPPRDNTEVQGERKSSSGQPTEQHMSTVLSERWPEAWLYPDSRGVTNGLAGWSGTWKLKVLGTSKFGRWVARKSGGKVCVWTSWTVRYFCLRSMSTKGHPLQRRLNKQVDKMTCSVEVSQSPSSDAQSFIFLFTRHLLSLIPSSSDSLSWLISFLLHIYHSHLHMKFTSLCSHYPMQVTIKSHMDTATTTNWSHVYSPTYSPHCNRNDVPWIKPECVTLLYKGSPNSPLPFM